MHLGVNVVRFTRKFTGVGRYMECVLKEWSQMDIPFETVTLFTHSPLKQGMLAFPLDRFNVALIGSKRPDPIWEGQALRTVSSEVDVLFCPSYTMPIGYNGKCLVTNLGPAENTPLSYQWWRSKAYEQLYKYSAHKADRVCACSLSVKKRLVDLYGVKPDKISVTYLASSEAFRPIDDPLLLERVKMHTGGDRPFILFVGKLAKRHYIPNLLQAFANLKKKRSFPHDLLLVGPDYLNLNIPRRAQKLGIGNSVIHIPYLFHEELPPLYNAAEIFIFPASEAEGFGIPVIEAMACGTPVITVNQGSLREFAPGAALVTESSDVSELQNAMEKMIFDAGMRKELTARGLERARTITWRFTAEKTMKILWDLAQS